MKLKDFMQMYGVDKTYTVMVGVKRKRYSPRIVEMRYSTAYDYLDLNIVEDVANGTVDSFGNIFVHIVYKALPDYMYPPQKTVLNGVKVKALDKTTKTREERRAKGGILGLF